MVTQTYTNGRREDQEDESDESLVRTAAAGNPDSYSVLVKRYYGQVYAIAYSHLQNRESAEELAQDVFVRGYLYVSKLTDRQRFPQWICRIARNLALNWVRDQRRRSEVIRMIPLDGLPDEPRDHAPSPRDAASAAQTETWLKEAVASLPADLREAVLLHYFENVPKSQIAELQGVNPSTLGRRLDQALLRLEQQVAGQATSRLKSQWNSSRQAKGAVALVAAAAKLESSSHAALLVKTADTLALGALSAVAVPVSGTPPVKAGATAMLSKTSLVVIGTSVMVVGVLAFPSYRHFIGSSRTGEAADGSELRDRSVSAHRASSSATPQALPREQSRLRRATNSLAVASSTTLPSSPVEARPLDSGTQSFDPAATTTATITVKVVNEEGNAVAGTKLSNNGARVATDSRAWTWSASGVSDEAGMVPLTVLHSVDNLEVTELLFQATHPAYRPAYAQQVPFSLEPTVTLKKDNLDKNILRVHVKDEAGLPIAGVTVQGQSVRLAGSPTSSSGWRGAPYKGSTDASGLAVVPYPVPAGVTGGKAEVTTAILGLYHPDYTNESKELAVDPPDQEVILKRGAEVIVSGYVTNPDDLATGLKVKIDDGAGAGVPWDEQDSDKSTWQQRDSTHLSNRKISPGTRALYAWAELNGIPHFSDITPVTVTRGEVKELNLQLKPGIAVRGKLSDNVPRPIVNGEVKWEIPNTTVKHVNEQWGSQERLIPLSHGGKAIIRPDGSFDLGFHPAGKMEVAAICNGWRSKDGVSLREKGFISPVIPQVFEISSSKADAIIDMEQTAGLSATVTTPDGEPFQGARVQFNPNVFFLNYSTIFIRNTAFTATTDAAGSAMIEDLPAGRFPMNVLIPGNQWQLPDELNNSINTVRLEPGKVTQLLIKLAPRTTGNLPAQK